jgi:hypothetical protein
MRLLYFFKAITIAFKFILFLLAGMFTAVTLFFFAEFVVIGREYSGIAEILFYGGCMAMFVIIMMAVSDYMFPSDKPETP